MSIIRYSMNGYEILKIICMDIFLASGACGTSVVF